MKIRTIDTLQDRLDSELSWRLKEIDQLKKSVHISLAAQQKTIIRAGVPLIYAHWEGFVKRCCEYYINYVSCQRLTFDELESNFVVLGAKKLVQEIGYSHKARLNIQVVNFFREKIHQRADIKYQSAIDTKSNLSSSVFENIALTVGINTGRYETRYNFIDESLLRRRNNIAHGEYLDLDCSDFCELADNVLLMLRWVKTDIENLASTESFKKNRNNAQQNAAPDRYSAGAP